MTTAHVAKLSNSTQLHQPHTGVISISKRCHNIIQQYLIKCSKNTHNRARTKLCRAPPDSGHLGPLKLLREIE